MNALGMTAGAAVLLAASVIAGESLALPQSTQTWLAIGYLVVIGSVVVFLLYLVVLAPGRHRGPLTGSCSSHW